jgi:hypothetical protein
MTIFRLILRYASATRLNPSDPNIPSTYFVVARQTWNEHYTVQRVLKLEHLHLTVNKSCFMKLGLIMVCRMILSK